MRKICLLSSMALALSLAACGAGTQKRLLTRPDQYDKLLGFPSTGNPLDIEALIEEYPELDGIVLTAPQYVEQYAKLVDEAKKSGKSVIPYKIPAGARLQVEVQGEDDLTRTYYVGPHGYIDFPYIGEVEVKGLTVRELRASIEDKLRAYLKRPKVLIHILNAPPGYRSQEGLGLFGGGSATAASIHVFGAVRGTSLTRGGVTFQGGETLLTVLGYFGLTSNAEWRQIRIVRRDGREGHDPLREGRIIICDLWAYFAQGDVRQDIPLLPGDVVFVPIKHTLGDQFREDWDLTLKYLRDALFLDEFRDAARSGGRFRD